MSSCRNWTIVSFTMATAGGMAPAYAQTDIPMASAPTASPSKKTVRTQSHQLEVKVRHALTPTKDLNSLHIVILARGGKVTLEGNAPTDAQIHLAFLV